MLYLRRKITNTNNVWMQYSNYITLVLKKNKIKEEKKIKNADKSWTLVIRMFAAGVP